MASVETYIAIDPSLTAGIAISVGGKIGVISWKRPKQSCKDPQGYTGAKFVRMLDRNLMYEDDLRAVICETGFYAKFVSAVKSHSMLEGTIRSWCVTHAVRFIGIAPQELKRLASGSGRSDKSSMIATARLLYPGVKIEDDNQADALCLLHVGTSMLRQEAIEKKASA